MKIGVKKIVSYLFMGLALYVGGYATGYSIHRHDSVDTERYSLLARRAQLDNPSNPRVNFTPLRRDIETYVASLGAQGENVSVYFEYLPTGVSVHTNENNVSIAASLMKVPAVMTLYQLADEGRVDLDKKVPLRAEWLNSEFGTLYEKGAGYQLTLREASQLALRDSDNTALLMIFSEIVDMTADQKSAINFLDLEFDTTPDERVLIGAQSYGSILKCLYVACYNSLDDSQEILGYLAESTSVNRLTKYISRDVTVAHKIGSFSQEYQSDCGIFYEPQKNYLVCVMIKGPDPEASENIAQISKIIYEFIATEVN